MISAILPVIIIVAVFFVIVRVATIILKMTGMDEDNARFQAISAFTGTGFTTKEAETAVENRVRKKTVVILMVLGKVGIVSVIGSLFFSFGKDSLSSDIYKALITIGLLLILYKVTAFGAFSRAINKFLEKNIVARGILKQRTLEELFHLPKGYGLAKLTITPGSGEKGLTLARAGFNKQDILILSIERGNNLIAFPHADDVIEENDKLLCYGLIKNIKLYAS